MDGELLTRRDIKNDLRNIQECINHWELYVKNNHSAIHEKRGVYNTLTHYPTRALKFLIDYRSYMRHLYNNCGKNEIIAVKYERSKTPNKRKVDALLDEIAYYLFERDTYPHSTKKWQETDLRVKSLKKKLLNNTNNKHLKKSIDSNLRRTI